MSKRRARANKQLKNLSRKAYPSTNIFSTSEYSGLEGGLSSARKVVIKGPNV
jgi:hypothetical protein